MMSSQLRAMLRTTTAQFLTETALIEAEVSSTGEWNQPVPLWTTVASDVPCRVITAQPQTNNTAQQVGSQEQLVDTYRIIAPYGTAFATNQRVTVGSVVYQVVGVVTDRTDETDTQAILTRAR